MTAQNCCDMFANAALQTSSNYAIGSDGLIAMSVEEANRSWCSSNGDNDHRAVTIEVASLTNKEPFEASPEAMDSLIKLCTDICLRNGIKKLLWQGNKSLVGQIDKQNMTVHRFFANKSCPGTYLYNKMGEIANKVNSFLGVPASQIEKPAKPDSKPSKIDSYQIKIISPPVNIRVAPGIKNDVIGVIRDKGVYTITEEAQGEGAEKWGKLKSGAGWISLDYSRMI